MNQVNYNMKENLQSQPERNFKEYHLVDTIVLEVLYQLINHKRNLNSLLHQLLETNMEALVVKILLSLGIMIKISMEIVELMILILTLKVSIQQRKKKSQRSLRKLNKNQLSTHLMTTPKVVSLALIQLTLIIQRKRRRSKRREEQNKPEKRIRKRPM